MSGYGGTQCDKIGVLPQAFYKQPDRCYRPRGTCLGGRQPVQLLQKAKNRTSGQRMFVEDYFPVGQRSSSWNTRDNCTRGSGGKPFLGFVGKVLEKNKRFGCFNETDQSYTKARSLFIHYRWRKYTLIGRNDLKTKSWVGGGAVFKIAD